jgi:DNA-binding transcriptional ArsR family regulator
MSIESRQGVVVRGSDEPCLAERGLITIQESQRLARTFQVLANDSRLRILHALVRADEMSVGDLADAVGMRQQAVSNQLRRLMDRGVVASRRDGNFIRYRIEDSCLMELIEIGLRQAGTTATATLTGVS